MEPATQLNYSVEGTRRTGLGKEYPTRWLGEQVPDCPAGWIIRGQDLCQLGYTRCRISALIGFQIDYE